MVWPFKRVEELQELALDELLQQDTADLTKRRKLLEAKRATATQAYAKLAKQMKRNSKAGLRPTTAFLGLAALETAGFSVLEPHFARADQYILGGKPLVQHARETTPGRVIQRALVTEQFENATTELEQETIPKVKQFKEEFKPELERLDKLVEGFRTERDYRAKYDSWYTFWRSAEYELQVNDDFWSKITGTELPKASVGIQDWLWDKVGLAPKRQEYTTTYTTNLKLILDILDATDEGEEIITRATEVVNNSFAKLPDQNDPALLAYRDSIKDEIVQICREHPGASESERSARVNALNTFLKEQQEQNKNTANEKLQQAYAALETAFEQAGPHRDLIEQVQPRVLRLYAMLDEAETVRLGLKEGMMPQVELLKQRLETRIRQIEDGTFIADEGTLPKVPLPKKKTVDSLVKDLDGKAKQEDAQIDNAAEYAQDQLGYTLWVTRSEGYFPWVYWGLTAAYAAAALALNCLLIKPVAISYWTKQARNAAKISKLAPEAQQAYDAMTAVERQLRDVDAAIGIKTNAGYGEARFDVPNAYEELQTAEDGLKAATGTMQRTLLQFTTAATEFAQQHGDPELSDRIAEALEAGDPILAYRQLETALIDVTSSAEVQTVAGAYATQARIVQKHLVGLTEQTRRESDLRREMEAATRGKHRGNYAGAVAEAVGNCTNFLDEQQKAIKTFNTQLASAYEKIEAQQTSLEERT